MKETLDKNRLLRLRAIDEALIKARENYAKKRKEYENRTTKAPVEANGITINELTEKTGQKTVQQRQIIVRDLNVIKNIVGEDNLIVETALELRRFQYRRVKRYRYSENALSIFSMAPNEQLKILSEKVSSLSNLKKNTVISIYSQLSSERDIISYTTNPREKNVDTKFSKLFNHIRNKQNIRFLAKSRTLNEKTSFFVSPWFLREYNRRWNLICYDLKEEKVRHFALDIIIRIYESNGKWRKPEKLSTIYKDIIGISLPETEAMDIVFWVDSSQIDYIETKPLHHSQKEAQENEIPVQIENRNGKYYKIHCKKNYELIRDLMSYHSNLIVLSPNEIVEDIKQKINDMSLAYSNT